MSGGLFGEDSPVAVTIGAGALLPLAPLPLPLASLG